MSKSVVEQVTCPECLVRQFVLTSVDDPPGRRLVYCDEEEGGCGEQFAVNFVWRPVLVEICRLQPVTEQGRDWIPVETAPPSLTGLAPESFTPPGGLE